MAPWTITSSRVSRSSAPWTRRRCSGSDRWPTRWTFSEGKMLLHQGDFAHEFMVVLEGRAEVVRDSESVAELGPGDFLGEVAALSKGQRNATVVARSQMRVAVDDRPGPAPHREGDAGRGRAAASSRARALPDSGLTTRSALRFRHGGGPRASSRRAGGGCGRAAVGSQVAPRRARAMGPVRSMRTLARVNQKDGFDCPGCAWPEAERPAHRRVLRERRQGGRRGGDEGARDARVLRALRHRAARRAVRLLARPARAPDRADGQALGLATATSRSRWDDAFGLIADELARLDSPDEAVFYTSGRTSNEAAFCYQLFVRALGTNNLPDCSNLCHESSGDALIETIGVGKGSVSLDDIARRRPDLRRRPEPGHEPPAHADRARDGQAARRADRDASTRCREPGLMRFKNPQTARGLIGRGTPLADLFLQVRVERRPRAASRR